MKEFANARARLYNNVEVKPFMLPPHFVFFGTNGGTKEVQVEGMSADEIEKVLYEHGVLRRSDQNL